MEPRGLKLIASSPRGISMSRRGNPHNDAKAESFMKTLEYEEVYRSEYRDLADARRQIGLFIESVYNQKRLHSALGYSSPAEFSQKIRLQAEVERNQSMSFSRHKEIYRSDVVALAKGDKLPLLPTAADCETTISRRQELFSPWRWCVLTFCLT